METEPTKKKFDWDKILAQSLSFAEHTRLMVLLLCVGCLMGVCYFVFSTPLYSSTALFKVNTFGLPVSEDNSTEVSTPAFRLNRQLVNYLRTEQFTKKVAVEKGWASDSDSALTVRRSAIPIVRHNWVDSQTLEVMVMSRHIPIVRGYPEAMVEVYQNTQRERRSEYREKGIALYLGELEQMRGQLDDEMDKRFALEKERDLTNLFIEQRNLKQVPRQLVLVNSRIEQLTVGLEKLGLVVDTATIPEKLSTLAMLETQALKIDDIGEFTRKKEGLSPLTETARGGTTATDIMIQPLATKNWENWERDRRELTEQLRKQKEVYLDGHPTIRDLNSQIVVLDQRLKGESEVRLRRLEVELNDLAQQRKELQARMPDYEKITREYEEFRRDYSLLTKGELAWDKMFEKMSQKVAALEFGVDKERMEIAFDGFVNLRDENPVSPNKAKLAMISVALSAGLAFGVPFLINLTNTTTTRIPDLEEASGVAGIGASLVDPTFLEEIVRSPMIDATVPNALLENFRLIRSNVCLHPNRKGGAKVVMVTSARPGEGKSTQAANLAWAFFSMGERTLIIDCDLRRGRQHVLTNVSNEKGMTHLLTGRATLEEVILKTPNEHLDVIPRGPVIAGSTDVLCQKFFDDVVAELGKHYQRIVIDTPPVLGLSETASLQRLTDGVVLVVRAEQTPQRDSIDAIEKLRKAGAHLFGFVLNGIDLNKMSNRYHYYYYSSAYYESFDDGESGDVVGDSGLRAEADPSAVTLGQPVLAAESGAESENLGVPITSANESGA